ncbi:hypothetical protein IWW55_006436 [Coemansia sp. RSA 2706]|nr:hypothetical protein LPJ63_002368 [Coemansia sp. RSA 2711]KAJ2288787.1 hypothetical protein IWW55_006436 [Coemansia sp. RSA 2706]KAJ2299188.1 hypothetical protein IWW54_006522 [Coemansia sp. RSA 2705]KAJ2305465.1 hypothetical protein IWW52_006412 [Coemansia sp. RSA 2704]KAJ2315814.1 hypothetical protein IWW51_005815 [Coemansia sp. RSA 2702]KAJ2385509.1 hypothetical protein H4S02_004295 [Coemansia sp. RSA 2611]KAJ2711799.1 hypothetical protein H4R23_006295 [Coemansia sp. Cherry 401B]
MKLFAGVLGLALLAAQQVVGLTPPAGADTLQQCGSVSVRKEVRSLSPDEWNAFKGAMQQAYEDRWIDWFGFLHERVATTVHSNAVFLVFHRKFTNDYEQILRRYNPDISLPYWNTMVDYQNPAGSSVLGDNYFGGNGDPANDNCVTTGVAGSWKLTFPDVHCLRRVYGEGQSINTWYSPEFMTSVLQKATTYADLRAGLENTIHGLPHLSLGGDMNTMHSPFDPVFWLHHANIDRMFAQWQAVDPDTRTYAYDGTDINGKTVALDDYITSTTTHVYEVMRLGYGNMCFTYDTIKAAGSADNNSLRRRQKCIVRPSKATETVKKLPSHVVTRHFPSFAKGGVINALENELNDFDPRKRMAADTDATPFTPSVADESLRGKMPYTRTLTDEYIMMMGSNATEVRDWEQRAHEMVDDLNKAMYLSPYLIKLQ